MEELLKEQSFLKPLHKLVDPWEQIWLALFKNQAKLLILAMNASQWYLIDADDEGNIEFDKFY